MRVARWATGPSWREVVATMSMTRRPSALISACPPPAAFTATVVPVRLNVPGLAASEIQPRTASFPGLAAGNSTTSKINYMGYANAMGDGAATSNLLVTAAQRHQVEVDKATGGNARGIPPRGRPV